MRLKSLTWAPRFFPDMNDRFDRVQKYVDSSCIRHMNKFTPMRSGMLVRSATLGTKIGSGRIEYSSPYARYLYYGRLMVSSITGSSYASLGEKKILTPIELSYDTSAHSLAGPFWFERMKAEKLDEIRAGAARIAGGTPRK